MNILKHRLLMQVFFVTMDQMDRRLVADFLNSRKALFYFNKKKKVTVWNTGEPNNHPFGGSKNGEQCVEIIARPDKDGSSEQIGKLNDIPCIKPTLGVICQIDG